MCVHSVFTLLIICQPYIAIPTCHGRLGVSMHAIPGTQLIIYIILYNIIVSLIDLNNSNNIVVYSPIDMVIWLSSDCTFGGQFPFALGTPWRAIVN